MKKISAIVFVLFVICTTAFSQTPYFRERGYKGNVSYTNMSIVWNGFDTSHGYMFNEHHYLGGGAGFFLIPARMMGGPSYPTYVHFYADYHAYCFKKASTLVAGIKIGYAKPVNPGNEIINAFELEPNIGWNWGLKSGQGITLSLGGYMLTIPVNSPPVTIRPRISLAFEF